MGGVGSPGERAVVASNALDGRHPSFRCALERKGVLHAVN